MSKHEAFLTAKTAKYAPVIGKRLAVKVKFAVELAGSYRRKESPNGDIDVVISYEANEYLSGRDLFSEILRLLADEGYITETLSTSVNFAGSSTTTMKAMRSNSINSGSATKKQPFAMGTYHEVLKFMGLCKLANHNKHRRIDIMFVPSGVWPFTMIHFTGNKLFNIDLRNHALSLGYTLSEHGLKYVDKSKNSATTNLGGVTQADVKKKLGKDTFETEEDVFKFLNLKYCAAHKRKASMLHTLKAQT